MAPASSTARRVSPWRRKQLSCTNCCKCRQAVKSEQMTDTTHQCDRPDRRPQHHCYTVRKFTPLATAHTAPAPSYLTGLPPIDALIPTAAGLSPPAGLLGGALLPVPGGAPLALLSGAVAALRTPPRCARSPPPAPAAIIAASCLCVSAPAPFAAGSRRCHSCSVGWQTDGSVIFRRLRGSTAVTTHGPSRPTNTEPARAAGQSQAQGFTGAKSLSGTCPFVRRHRPRSGGGPPREHQRRRVHLRGRVPPPRVLPRQRPLRAARPRERASGTPPNAPSRKVLRHSGQVQWADGAARAG